MDPIRVSRQRSTIPSDRGHISHIRHAAPPPAATVSQVICTPAPACRANVTSLNPAPGTCQSQISRVFLMLHFAVRSGGFVCQRGWVKRVYKEYARRDRQAIRGAAHPHIALDGLIKIMRASLFNQLGRCVRRAVKPLAERALDVFAFH